MVEHNQSQYYGNQYKFNGKELDSTTGMYYYGARYYEPRFSIFVSVDPLAEKYPGIGGYVYVANNPIRYTDPTGMEPEDWIFTFTNGFLTKITDTGVGSAIIIVNDNKSLNPSSITNMQRISQYDQIVKAVGGKLNNKVNFAYKELGGKGGHYDRNNNEIVVTSAGFRFDNIYDLVNIIVHEDLHYQRGNTKSFKDHALVYKDQAKHERFSKSSDANKYSNAHGFAQRIINAYVDGDYGGNTDAFFKDINEYNKLNSKYQVTPNLMGDPSIRIGNSKEDIYPKLEMKHHE
jgi:RHS repeat-associated protein